MKIKTLQFGEVEFTEDKVVNFPNGLFGFEELKKFLFIYQETNYFYWLNSIDSPEIAFPMFGIRAIDEKFPQENDSEAFGIVNLNKDPLQITINLKAPVYINQDEKTGFQKIIDTDNYPVNYNLFTE